MKKKKISLSINTYLQAKEVVEVSIKLKTKPILYIKNYLIKNLSIEWLLTLKDLLEKNYPSNNFKFFVDSGYDYGLSILLAMNKIDFIKLKSNPIIIRKIRQITKKNRVLLNPTFDVVELSNIKNINKKLYKIYMRQNK